MKKASLENIAKKMKNLDLCMMVTQDGRHGLHTRPMSNNGKVEYDGNSWFFTYLDSNKTKQIEADPKVTLLFQSKESLFIACDGKASIVKDASELKDKWVDSLDSWFPKGVDTPGLCLIKVSATRIHFWDGNEEGMYES